MTYDELKEFLKQSSTFQEASKKAGVSRQRVHQLLSKWPDLRHELKTKEKKPSATELRRQARYGGMARADFHADSLRHEQQQRLNRKRANAAKAGHKFEVEWSELEWPTHCPVLGIELDYYSLAGKRSENSASFDRINPKLGYVKGNVIIMSWRANRIKNDGTAEEHRKIAEFLDGQE